jgi:N-acetylglucosamine-6-sulfatase
MSHLLKVTTLSSWSISIITLLTRCTGGWTKWNAGGYNDRSLPVFFREAGYNTYYTGKLLNEIIIYNFNNPYPAGWTGSQILVDPFGYDFFNAGLLHNQDNWTLYENQYSTDLIAKFSYEFLEDGVKAYQEEGTPFFIGMEPIAPHSQIIFTDITDPTSSELSPPVPAPRHAHMFPMLKCLGRLTSTLRNSLVLAGFGIFLN